MNVQSLSIQRRFNDLFPERCGWIYYASLDINVAKAAIEKAEADDYLSAETDLAEYYDNITINQGLSCLIQLSSFQKRWQLAQKALDDYNEERYYACIPVVLSLIEGVVTDSFLIGQGPANEIPLENINSEAWESISHYDRGLKALATMLRKNRFRTNTLRITKPYRHGILHGMDLSYDNKIVAAKTWAALFSILEWAIEAEAGSLAKKQNKQTHIDSKENIFHKESRISDIPLINNPLRDLENFEKLLANSPQYNDVLMANKIDISKMGSSMRYYSHIPDRFNDLLSDLGWIYYESMKEEVVKIAIQKAEAGDIDGAEITLTNYYDNDTIRHKIQRMKDVKAFRPRWHLAQKALFDYNEGRYYACVPVVLAILDGTINEAHLKGRSSRKGFHSKDADLEAWNSLSAHRKGLKKLARIIGKDRYETNTERITIPYRHGILHGLDLNYDYQIVAAKAWAALFSVRDWAKKAEQGLLDPQPTEKPMTCEELIQQLIENENAKAQLNAWKPRDIKLGQNIPITGGPDDYEMGTPEQKLTIFLSQWMKSKPNYRTMADCIVSDSSDNPKELPKRIREIYDSKHLKSFEFTEIQDTASATSIIQVRLNYEESGEQREKQVKFVMNSINSRGEPEVKGTRGSNWFIRFWEMV